MMFLEGAGHYHSKFRTLRFYTTQTSNSLSIYDAYDVYLYIYDAYDALRRNKA